MSALTPLRYAAWLSGAAFVWLGIVAAAPLVGAERIDLGRALAALFGTGGRGMDYDILVLQRIPRSLLGGLAGGVLGLSGAAFQTVLRNPLASPFTLGVASAGSLGAVVVIHLGVAVSLGPFSSVQLGALAGAAADVALVVALARRARGNGGAGISVLLAGVTVSLVAGAIMMLVRYLSSPYRLVEMDRWLMGGVDVVGLRPIAGILPVLVPTVAIVLYHMRDMDQIGLGSRMAAARGVDVAGVQWDVFLGGSLATAAVVSVTGPIGFVGLIVPHAVRRFTPRDHRIILPVCFAAGGVFLVLADSAARVVVAPAELPVGVLTAAIGGPVFLAILARIGLSHGRPTSGQS